jgi:hypothetical protein
MERCEMDDCVTSPDRLSQRGSVTELLAIAPVERDSATTQPRHDLGAEDAAGAGD